MLQVRKVLTASVLGFGILLTSGCSLFQPKEVEVTATPTQRPVLNLPDADQLRLRKLQWIVVTPENWNEVKDLLDNSGRPVVLFALTDEGYENLGLNISDIRAYIEQQKTIIAAYEAYYQMAEELEGDLGEPSNRE